MTTQKQKDSAINRFFKRFKKVVDHGDKYGRNPYIGIYYYNGRFYVTDSILIVRTSYYKEIDLPNIDQGTYYKVNVIDQVDQVRPLFNLYQDEQTERMTYDHSGRGIEIFDRFFVMKEPSNEITVDPKFLNLLLDLFATNKIMPTITKDASKIKLSGSNDFCSMEAVLMGVRK